MSKIPEIKTFKLDSLIEDNLEIQDLIFNVANTREVKETFQLSFRGREPWVFTIKVEINGDISIEGSKDNVYLETDGTVDEKVSAYLQNQYAIASRRAFLSSNEKAPLTQLDPAYEDALIATVRLTLMDLSTPERLLFYAKRLFQEEHMRDGGNPIAFYVDGIEGCLLITSATMQVDVAGIEVRGFVRADAIGDYKLMDEVLAIELFTSLTSALERSEPTHKSGVAQKPTSVQKKKSTEVLH